jgi:hypothetical protein
MEPEKIIDLDPPIVNGGGKIAQIKLREPTTGEVLKAEEKLSLGQTPATRHQRDIELVTLVAGIPADAVKAMRITDFNAAVVYLDAFVEASQLVDYTQSRPPDLQLQLLPPIELHNRRHDVLELREPLTGELDKSYAELGSARDPASIRKFQILLVALVSGCHRGIIERVPITVLDEGFRYLAGFTAAGRRIGAI